MSDGRTDRLLVLVLGQSLAPAELPRAGVLVIGNDRKRAGFVVDGEGVADVHCAIGRTKGGGWAIKDLGSTAGTIVNGKRVESARLAAGDQLTLGSIALRVVDPERPITEPAPARRAEDTRALEAFEMSNELLGEMSRAQTVPAPRTDEKEPARGGSLPQIPGYRLERQLGRGGMGDVYLAVQESLERQVALKVLAARFEADREFVRRFQAEARAAAALNHPNVVTVYDVGEAKGTHYLSMEYMEKGNLEDRVGKGTALSEREVLDILRDAAIGLVYAEQRGIVHRDLKPANLMQNHVGQTKIADLGLATHVESEEAQSVDKKVFGTPHFMSPEQARGERVDHRSDLYSLGATAYRLLTGHTPFEGQNARDIVRSLLRDEPRAMRELVPGLSDGSVGLVSRLMKKDAAQRFASAADVLREIERLRAPAPQATSLKLGTAGKPRSRGGGVVVLLLLAAAGGGAWWWKEQRDAQTAVPTHTQSPDTASNTTPNTGADQPVVKVAPKDPGTTASGTDPKPKVDGSKEKDDKELQLFEANAKVALLELLGKNMGANDRRDALRSLASQFQGTNAAAEALERADGITNEIVDAASRAEARKGEVDAVVARMRVAAQLDDKPPHPGFSFLKMREVEGQLALAQVPEFITARKSVEAAVSKTAVHYAEGVLSAAKGDWDRGDFDAAKKKLEDLLKVLDLPDFSNNEAPSGVGELYEIGRRARERFHTLDAMKVVYATKRDREDALAFARGLGGTGGLEHEIKTLDFSAARARLEALTGKLSSPGSQGIARELAQDCLRARSAIEALARECAAGNWRRKSFTDPRDRKNTSRNAVGADTTGILYEPDGGGTEHVPWSAFGGNTKELSKLFFERCTHEWNAEETASIAALVRLEAVVEALEISGKMFDPARKVNFTETNQKDLHDCLTQALVWAQRAGQGTEKAAREGEAGALLASVLRQATEGQWSTAVAGGERLLRDFTDTLLVRMMSNGELAADAPAEGIDPEPPEPPKDAVVPKESDPPKR